MANNDTSQYRGKRALILTRVSTPKQEEKYSHAAQLRQVREKLIIPLGLRIVDEKKHIIHDTYSGLEYRYRKALEMAERQEFDVLCMEVLDRGLGRRALARELFRMQLKGGGKCPGVSYSVDALDSDVAEYIRELIRDPSVVDEKIQQLQAENPTQKQQQRKLKNLNAILREQETFRNNLAAEMRKKTFSERTVAFLNTQLTMLEQQEEEARRDLADEQRVQEQHEILDRRIAEFHKQCQEWREKLDDPQFTPDFQFYQDAVLFFSIHVMVWRTGIKPRHEIYTTPSEITASLS